MSRSSKAAPPAAFLGPTDRQSVPWTHAAWMITIMLIAGLFAVLAGHLITVRGGVGFDGRTYATAAADFPRSVSAYRVWRVGPSLAVGAALKILGINKPSTVAVVTLFRMLNLGACIAAVLTWFGIARTVRLGSLGAWFGFTALFLNFGVFRFPWIYPVLADTSAFAVTLLLVLAYLRHKRGAVLLLGLASGFIWQLTFYAALVMLILPADWADEEKRAKPAPGWIVAGIGGGAAAIWALLLPAWNPSWKHGFPVAAALLGAYVLGAAAPLLRHLFTLRPRQFVSRSIALGLIGSVTLVAATYYLHHLMASSRATDPSALDAITNWLATAIAVPGAFLVAHVVYFGPWLLLAVFLWPRVVRRGAGHGPAFAVLMFVTALIAVGSESRHLLPNMIFLALPATQAVDEFRLRPVWLALFAAASVVWTRPWIDTGVVAPGHAYGMNIGPQMLLSEFAIYGIAVAAMALFIWMALRKTDATPVQAT